jgi:hypothetical protein
LEKLKFDISLEKALLLHSCWGIPLCDECFENQNLIKNPFGKCIENLFEKKKRKRNFFLPLSLHFGLSAQNPPARAPPSPSWAWPSRLPLSCWWLTGGAHPSGPPPTSNRTPDSLALSRLETSQAENRAPAPPRLLFPPRARVEVGRARARAPSPSHFPSSPLPSSGSSQ